ncbi:MAG: hypothetical protein M3Y82_08110 [Verrucomicrobiota bacterium]|nr:hypothetical protein [Verrucomicrobiota bacterium]
MRGIYPAMKLAKLCAKQAHIDITSKKSCTSVPMHQSLKPKTHQSILKQANLSIQELKDAL